jgi:hypothetical protein
MRGHASPVVLRERAGAPWYLCMSS